MADPDPGAPERSARQQRSNRRGHEMKLEILDAKPLLRHTNLAHAEDMILFPRRTKFRSPIAVPLNHRIVGEGLDTENAAARCHNSMQLRERAREVEMVQHSRAQTRRKAAARQSGRF